MSRKLFLFIAWMSVASLVSFGQGSLERTVRQDAASGFTIITDTIGIDLSSYSTPVSNMELEYVVDYRGNNLYLFGAFNYTAFHDFLDEYHIVSVSPNNERQTFIEIPPQIKFGWYGYSLSSKDNQLYLWSSREPKKKYPDLCWDDDSKRWIEMDQFSTTCYEDKDFAVSFEPQGEWGLFTCFHDKRTGLKHLFNADMDKIVRYHDTYYIISKAVIYEVKDPREGWVMDNTHYTQWGQHTPTAKTFISSKYKSYWDFDEYYMGDDQSSDTLYFSGFIHDDNFYVLAGNRGELFLAQILPTGQPKFQKVLTLEKMGQDYPYGPYMSNNWNPNRSLSTFRGNWNTNVILDLKSDTVHFTYLRTQPDTLQYLGPEVLPKMMNYLTDNIGKVTMDDVTQFEKQLGGKTGKVIRESNNGYFPQSGDSNFELITYYHAIDENDSFEVEYCRHKESNVAAAVFIEFEQTQYYQGENRFFDESRNITKKTLPEMMEQYLASPPDSIDMKNENYPGRYWHRHGHTYFLHDDRITIY